MARVFIGVGHGGKDPGAVKYLKESDVNLVMALKMKSELERHGVDVGISRTKDEDDDIAEEIKEATLFNPDIAVDIHNNAGGGKGFEVICQTNKYKSDSVKLASLMEEEVKIIGQNSRGIKTKLNSSGSADSFGFLRLLNCPAVIVEGAFVDNKLDVEFIDTKEEQERFGTAYAKAVLRFFDIPLKDGEDDNQKRATIEFIVSKLSDSGIITDKTLWLEKLSNDEDVYWLAYKTAAFIDKSDIKLNL